MKHGLEIFGPVPGLPIQIGVRKHPPAAGGGTAYVTSDQSAVITITNGAASGPAAGVIGDLINGTQADSLYFGAFDVSDAASWFRFTFASAKIIDEAKWYQDLIADNGTWKWQASNVASPVDATSDDWTDIGTTFTLGGGLATSTQTQLNGNVTAYLHYRLKGTAGNFATSQYVREIQFKRN